MGLAVLYSPCTVGDLSGDDLCLDTWKSMWSQCWKRVTLSKCQVWYMRDLEGNTYTDYNEHLFSKTVQPQSSETMQSA